MIRKSAVLIILCCTLAGCFDKQTSLPIVPDSASAPVIPVTAKQASYVKVTGEMATRINDVGQVVLKANPTIGMRPLFHTFGDEHPEIFHRGTAEIGITVGLVKACASDGELAAVIALELAKMVSEREARMGAQVQKSERQPPMEVIPGNDKYGLQGPTDMTRLAELAAYEKDRRHANEAPAPPPDPKTLARLYLIKAGFAASELDNADSILGQAARNGNLEKQFNGTPELQRPFTPK